MSDGMPMIFFFVMILNHRHFMLLIYKSECLMSSYSRTFYKTPFVDGNCIFDKSRFTAILIALAKALNIASIL